MEVDSRKDNKLSRNLFPIVSPINIETPTKPLNPQENFVKAMLEVIIFKII